jgi:hypothetical protein
MAVMTYIDAINTALREEMERTCASSLLARTSARWEALSKPPRGYWRNLAVNA